MSIQQQSLMVCDPATGEEKPYPSHAEQYRKYHGEVAWIFNPWTKEQRDARDIGSDIFGHLIVPPGESVAVDRISYLYKDLLDRLGCNGHEGAIFEIDKLRECSGLY